MNNYRNEKKFYYEKLPPSAEQQQNIDYIVNEVMCSKRYPYLKEMMGTFRRGLLPTLLGIIKTYDSLRNAEIDPFVVVDGLVYRYICNTLLSFISFPVESL